MKASTTLLAAGLALSAAAALAHGPAGDAAPKLDHVKTAFGETGDPRQARRTVAVSMSDRMRFSPSQLSVRQGETVRFVVTNAGAAMHEMVIGTEAELRQHAEMMRRHPGMEHDAPYMAHVAPGKSGEIVWKFTQPGEFRFGCLVPGHFEAGMAGSITVVRR